MSKTEVAFSALVAVSFGLITAGAVWFSIGLGLIVAGVSVAAWSWLILGGEPNEPAAPDDALADDDDETVIE